MASPFTTESREGAIALPRASSSLSSLHWVLSMFSFMAPVYIFFNNNWIISVSFILDLDGSGGAECSDFLTNPWFQGIVPQQQQDSKRGRVLGP